MNGWCTDFGDPALDELVSLALANNLDLQAASARVDQVVALSDMAESGFWPNLDLQVAAGRSRGAGPLGPTERDQFSISAPAAYEVDIWGRVAAAASAADLDAEAARLDFEAIAMTLAANVAETWFDVVQQREALNLLQEQLATLELFREIIFLRMGQGQASAPDVLQQQLQVDGLRAQMELARARLATSEYRLAVLLGELPTAAVGGTLDTLPDLPAVPDIGVPADLLEQRPDVAAARRRVGSADLRVSEAIAARLPGLRISGSLSFSSAIIGDLFDEIFWSILASITAPLFDGGRRAAEVERTEAVLHERFLSYASTLLTAVREVESALVLERQQGLYIDRLLERQQTATQSLELERWRYISGVSDFLRVLSGLTALQQVEQSLLDAQRQLLSYRVQLCRAVGGNWTREL